jgi:type IX secretion system PorP/SprF family membrane protein
MKKTVFVLIYVLVVQTASSQFVSQFSQYMFVKSEFNPGAIADNGDMARLSAIHKLQWVGISGAPVNTYVNFSTPFSIKKNLFGAGLSIENQTMGLFSKQNIEVTGAYKLKLLDGILSLGLNAGLVNVSFAGDSVSIPSGDYGNDYHVPAGSDPLIPTSKISGLAFNMSLGAYFYNNKFNIGLSVLNVTAPTIRWSDTQETYVGRMLYLTGGYNLSLANPYFTLKPSVLIKTNFVNYQTDMNLILDYHDKWWGGLGYRFDDAVMFMGGIRLINGLTVGYTFDLPTTSILGASFGSHEIFVTYDFMISFEKRNRKYKSVRIL